MKKLYISLKSPTEALNDFGKALERAREAKGKVAPHYERRCSKILWLISHSVGDCPINESLAPVGKGFCFLEEAIPLSVVV